MSSQSTVQRGAQEDEMVTHTFEVVEEMGRDNHRHAALRDRVARSTQEYAARQWIE